MAAIFSSLMPTVRHDLQCWEKTNWLPRSQPGAGLAELAQRRVEQTLRAAVEGEAADAVAQDVGDEGEHGPPVARRARRRPGLGDRVAVGPEQLVVHLQGQLVVGLVAADLAQAGHRVVSSVGDVEVWCASWKPIASSASTTAAGRGERLRSSPAGRRGARPARSRCALIVSSSSVTGWSTMRTPAAASVASSSDGERPPSTALYSSGVPGMASPHAAQLVDVGDRLDEHDVGAGGDESAGAVDGVVDAVRRRGRRCGRRRGRLRRAPTATATRSAASSGDDDRLALEVAAPLGHHLVLDLHGGGAGRLDLGDGATHVERAAEAGVDVDDQRQRRRRGDPPGRRDDVVEADQTEVGEAERRRRQGEPGDVRGGEPRLLDQPAAEGVGAPRDVEQPTVEQPAQVAHRCPAGSMRRTAAAPRRRAIASTMPAVYEDCR